MVENRGSVYLMFHLSTHGIDSWNVLASGALKVCVAIQIQGMCFVKAKPSK